LDSACALVAPPDDADSESEPDPQPDSNNTAKPKTTEPVLILFTTPTDKTYTVESVEEAESHEKNLIRSILRLNFLGNDDERRRCGRKAPCGQQRSKW
jgi:hypothetical protein